MKRNFKEALKHRRSHYALGGEMLVSREEVEEMVAFALMHVPSAFNSQSTRVTVMWGNAHHRLWQMVKESLQVRIPEGMFARTAHKIDTCFAAGYGTLLFWEDRSVVEEQQRKYPLYADSFPQWSQHTSAMHQLALWCMLEDAGLGASLQHYNPLIDEAMRSEWELPPRWELVAQMPFGYPLVIPEVKEHESVEERMRVFG